MVTSNRYDVLIIGSGPAGLWGAYELLKRNPGLKVGIAERGRFSSGGLMNDCKLNLTTKIGMDLNEIGISEEEANGYIREIDDKFLALGAEDRVYGEDEEANRPWMKRAKWAGIQLIVARQRHVGTDKSKHLIRRFTQELEGLGARFHLNTEIYTIDRESDGFLLRNAGQEFRTKHVLAAPGRNGSTWFREQAKRLGIDVRYGPIDIGVRLEMPNEVMEDITSVIYDPKMIFYTKSHGEKVRTFCTNRGGNVRIEPDNGKGFRLVNGDALSKYKSRNTNFAILNTTYLTEPYADTHAMGRDMAQFILRLGGGMPLVQRMGDFRDGKRSKMENFFNGRYGPDFKPSLGVGSRVTPGDICRGYTGVIIDNLREAFDRFDRVVPGIADDQTIIYAPEIKFYDSMYPSTPDLETSVEGLFIAGDGVGKSRGIIGAAMTGMIAARGILKKL